MRRIPFIFLFSALLLGCVSTKKVKEANLHKPLTSTYWELYAISGNIMEDNSPKTAYIVFDTNGTYHGNFGCNRFFGNYFQNGKKKITMEYAGATKMLCPDMQTEKLFYGALKREIKQFKIEGKMLILSTKNEEVIRFYAVDTILKP